MAVRTTKEKNAYYYSLRKKNKRKYTIYDKEVHAFIGKNISIDEACHLMNCTEEELVEAYNNSDFLKERYVIGTLANQHYYQVKTLTDNGYELDEECLTLRMIVNLYDVSDTAVIRSVERRMPIKRAYIWVEDINDIK